MTKPRIPKRKPTKRPEPVPMPSIPEKPERREKPLPYFPVPFKPEPALPFEPVRRYEPAIPSRAGLSYIDSNNGPVYSLKKGCSLLEQMII